MIIGLTGRIAAGKETLTEFFRQKGFVYLESSKLLNDELIKRGIEITRKNQQDLGDELRRKFGAGILMKMFLDKLDKNKNYVIDSLRNPKEAEFLRNCGIKFFLIAVDAPQELRFQRVLKRGKLSDPKTWEEFLKTDERDFASDDPLGQQVGKCFELADFIILNDGYLKNSQIEVERIWTKINQ